MYSVTSKLILCSNIVISFIPIFRTSRFLEPLEEFLTPGFGQAQKCWLIWIMGSLHPLLIFGSPNGNTDVSKQ